MIFEVLVKVVLTLSLMLSQQMHIIKVELNMHEYKLTNQIIEIAENHCRKASAHKVKNVTIVVGDYSGVAAESIDMYFDVISEGTLCEGAKIKVERVRPKLLCPACGGLFTRQPMSFACPECGEDGNPTEIGKEFYVKEIEVE